MTQTSTGADETSTTDRVREAGSHVAGTAADEASNVTHEVGAQARNLAGEVRSQLSSQVSTQQERAAGGIRSMSDELRSMADSSESHGVASNLVSQAASRAGDVAGWLEGRDPSAVLDDVKRFARQRPGLFIAIAAGAGIVVGRLAKSLASGNDSADGAPGANAAGATPTATVDTTAGYSAPVGYSEPAGYPAPATAGSQDFASGDIR
ncbi:ElaB/YqjD/DUF883 family membrane-anchored ribosome-binding protein [Mycetocola sp. CAN_C7]|uniref:hypothetical protein n=1 Tax=Mycetocola sp. CAN_C7 TaxID=2787724 RepID=UPI0018C9CEEA